MGRQPFPFKSPYCSYVFDGGGASSPEGGPPGIERPGDASDVRDASVTAAREAGPSFVFVYNVEVASFPVCPFEFEPEFAFALALELKVALCSSDCGLFKSRDAGCPVNASTGSGSAAGGDVALAEIAACMVDRRSYPGSGSFPLPRPLSDMFGARALFAYTSPFAFREAGCA